MSDNTPYDDVFRTLMLDCSGLLIPIINEVFGECYTGDEAVLFSQNEHYFRQQDGKESERITDSSFWIQGDLRKRYHFECQSTPDQSMLIRMFEYDAQIALEDSVFDEGHLTVHFPASAVLYLRTNSHTPQRMEIEILTSNGKAIHEVRVMTAPSYELEDIFKKKLYFLIPFYIFRFEKDFKAYDTDEQKRNSLILHFLQLRKRLEVLCEQGQMDAYTKCTILEMTNKVVSHLTVRYQHVQEGVNNAMGGQVLEYEAKTILNRGRQEGRDEGRTEGAKEAILAMQLVSQGYSTLAELCEQGISKEVAEQVLQ